MVGMLGAGMEWNGILNTAVLKIDDNTKRQCW
jgi:hypothetical protein